jgi:hypothetical protein
MFGTLNEQFNRFYQFYSLLLVLMGLLTTPEMSNGSQKAGMTFSEKLNKILFITLFRPRYFME